MRFLLVCPWLAPSLALGCAGLPSEQDRAGIECEAVDECEGSAASAEPAAVTVTVETLRVERSYTIDEPSADNDFTTRYRNADRHSYDLHLLKVANEHGLALWFVVDAAAGGSEGGGLAPYGARLLRATLDGEDLLYTNQEGRLSPNWGPREVDGDRIVGTTAIAGAAAIA